MFAISIWAIIAKLRDFLFRLWIHRRPRPRPPRPRESNDSPTQPSHPFVPHPPAPPPTTIAHAQVLTSLFPVPDLPKKKALLIGIRGTGDSLLRRSLADHPIIMLSRLF